MLTLDEIKRRLADRNLSEVARQSGVYYITLTNIMSGATADPKYSTLKALSDYLEAQP
jgi:predicted transcriptional regulator